ncbi:MAG: cohesin domain-containing protein, partial [bacterium]|nr:cohesin domain-containing protein [bacterium]
HRTPWVKYDQLAQADGSFYFANDDAETGYSVAGIGDINNDGIPDFAIGAFGRSRVFIIFGKRSVNWGKNFDLENADLILYGTTRIANEGLGWRVAGAGDFNGDGISDVLISAIHDIDGGFHAGKVYVLFGRNGGWPYQEIILNNECDATYLGELPDDQAGWGLANAGDVDDDGFDDFLVGTYKDENGPVDGKAYLIRGKATDWKRNVPFATIPDYCERAAEGVGFACASAGDFDNDGISDFLIAAPFNNEVQKWNGEVYLFASQQIPYKIAGSVSYFQSQKSIPGAILSADPAYMDTTDQQGNYQLFVRGKKDYTVRLNKTKGEHVGSAITSYDAALIARMAVNLDVPNSSNKAAADANSDSRINMYDAAITLRFAVQLPPLTDSHAGEWVFNPSSMFYDSITSDQLNQNFQGYIISDVDGSYNSPGFGLMKITSPETEIITHEIQPGAEFFLPIEINSEQQMLSLDLDLRYDQSALEFLRIETTAASKNFQLAYNANFNDRLLIGAYTQNPINEAGKLLLIVFKAKEHADQQTEIRVANFLINNASVPLATVKIAIGDPTQMPDHFQLMQNYPNPFNHATAIPYEVTQKEHIRIIISNTLGQQIKTLIDAEVLPGTYVLTWDGKDEFGNLVTSGVYLCKASLAKNTRNIKLVYMK